MQSSVSPNRSALNARQPSRLNWGLILTVGANAVLVVGIIMLIKAILTFGVMRLFGIE